MAGCKTFVGKGWTLVDLWVHAYRTTVYNHRILLQYHRCQLAVSESVGTAIPAHVGPFDPQVFQTTANGFAGSSRTEHQGFPVI